MRVVLGTAAAVSGGVWRHMTDLAVGLRSRGVDVTFGLNQNAAALRGEAAGAGFTVAGGMDRCDVWHLHLADTLESTSVMQAARARCLGARVVLTEHLPRTPATDARLMPGPRRLGARQVKTLHKRAQFLTASSVIAVSRGSARFLSERYDVEAAKVIVIPNGVGLQDVVPLPGGVLHLVSLGSVIAQKGHEVLVEAAELATEPWSVSVLGDGPHRQRLAERARRTGRVSFAGWVHPVEPAVLSAHAVCLPSLWEAFPYSALEAMALGRAVVGSRVDGLEDIVLDRVTGRLVAPSDPEALARVLDELAQNMSALGEWGSNGRRHVEESFSIDRMVESVLAVYEDVLR